MIAPSTPLQETCRLEALYSLSILDTTPEKEFDDITALAALLCDTKTALISLIDKDRQWFKSIYGTMLSETPRAYSFCAHAILEPNSIFVVPDIQKDERFHDNPLTKGEDPIIFYAGVPLITKDNFALGTLCVIDNKERELTVKQITALETLAKQVMSLFELKHVQHAYERMQYKLKQRDESLRKIGRIVSHDVKTPIANIVTITDILKLKLSNVLDDECLEYFKYIKESSFTMSTYINNILNHYESDLIIPQEREIFSINTELEIIIEGLQDTIPYHITLPPSDMNIRAVKSDFILVFDNLISNSLRYNDKKIVEININASQDDLYYYFSITDNGIGIAEDLVDKMLDLFKTANIPDRNGIIGNGIGLSTVKKTVHNMEGIVSISSKLSSGTTVNFSIKKQSV